jgi:hypothetical protein
MKKLALVSLLSLCLFGFIQISMNKKEIFASIKIKKENSISCSPYFSGLTEAGDDGKFITVLPGWEIILSISTKKEHSFISTRG